jgi:hypothetical protein
MISRPSEFWGFEPAPPGRSILLDRTKRVAFGSLSKIMQAITPFTKPGV